MMETTKIEVYETIGTENDDKGCNIVLLIHDIQYPKLSKRVYINKSQSRELAAALLQAAGESEAAK